MLETEVSGPVRDGGVPREVFGEGVCAYESLNRRGALGQKTISIDTHTDMGQEDLPSPVRNWERLTGYRGCPFYDFFFTTICLNVY